MAVDSLEFDDEGTATMSFVAVRRAATACPSGSTGATQRVGSWRPLTCADAVQRYEGESTCSSIAA
jgi:hypothetical protein